MKKLIPFLLAANIVWSRPDGGVSVTQGDVVGTPAVEGYKGNSQSEAARMIAQGYVPGDWVAIAYDVEIPSNRLKRDKWKWDSNSSKVRDDLPGPPNGTPAPVVR